MPRTAADPNAPKVDPRVTFVALVEKRTSAAIKALASVAKLPAKGRKDGDTQKIVAALRHQIDAVEARLNSAAPEAPLFKLD